MDDWSINNSFLLLTEIKWQEFGPWQKARLSEYIPPGTMAGAALDATTSANWLTAEECSVVVPLLLIALPNPTSLMGRVITEKK